MFAYHLGWVATLKKFSTYFQTVQQNIDDSRESKYRKKINNWVNFGEVIYVFILISLHVPVILKVLKEKNWDLELDSLGISPAYGLPTGNFLSLIYLGYK